MRMRGRRKRVPQRRRGHFKELFLNRRRIPAVGKKGIRFVCRLGLRLLRKEGGVLQQVGPVGSAGMKRRRIRGARLASGGEQGTLMLGGNLTGGREGKAGRHLRQRRQGIREGGLRGSLVLSLCFGNERRLQLMTRHAAAPGTVGRSLAGGRHVRLSRRRRTGFGCRRRRLKSRGVAWLHGGFVRRLSACVCADQSGPPFQIGRNIGDGGCGRDVSRGRFSRRPVLVGRERSRKRRKSLRRRQFFALLRQRAGR